MIDILNNRSQIQVIGKSHDLEQCILIESQVLIHLDQYRQKSYRAHESGGQLFGKINSNLITVSLSTGPYKGDESGRYHYRSNPKAAQLEINKQSKRGLLYLGEWHTHAENFPTYSYSDRDAMHKLITLSQLNLSALILLIVGLSPEINGYQLCMVAKESIMKLNLSHSS